MWGNDGAVHMSDGEETTEEFDEDDEDMPALEPIDVDPSATVVDAEFIRATHLLQQFMDNGYINEDIDEVSFQLSNANSIVFQRMDT